VDFFGNMSTSAVPWVPSVCLLAGSHCCMLKIGCLYNNILFLEVFLGCRLLAHARVESAKSKEAAIERERLRNSPWWTFGWGTLNPAATTHKETEVTPIGHLTNEEWNKINSLLSYQPEEDTSKQEAPDMMQFALDVRVQQCTARVLDRKKMEILCGTFEDLQVGLKVYPKTLACEGKLQFYGLSAPEGVLIEVLLI
jgi:vacuolar protein sorting-associated protein 13A/C